MVNLCVVFGSEKNMPIYTRAVLEKSYWRERPLIFAYAYVVSASVLFGIVNKNQLVVYFFLDCITHI